MRADRVVLPIAALGLAAAVCCVSCSGGDPKEAGYEALDSGDYSAAVAHFERALEGSKRSSAEYVEVSVARCQALAHVDAERAEADFGQLNGEIPDPTRLTERDFNLVVTELLGTDGAAAVRLMDAGVKRFPDSDRMKQIRDKVIEAVKKSKDPSALSALEGMGYIGDD